MKKITLLLLTLVTAPITQANQQNQQPDENNICPENCTFVLKSQSGSYDVINRRRAETPMTPFSTFKIPNSLIALDTGVVSDLKQTLTVNKEKYPRQRWWPKIWDKEPLTLREAFQNSALPLYQQIATEVGSKRMRRYVDRFNYGNQHVSENLDTFWLNDSIRISALEQVEFLEELVNQKLPVKQRTYDLFKQVMLVESTDNYKLYAKTGGGMLGKGLALGWYVGYVETKQDTYFFALNLEAKTFQQLQSLRKQKAKQLLSQFGVI